MAQLNALERERRLAFAKLGMERKESAIQKTILTYLKIRGIFAWKAGVGVAKYGMTGRYVRFGLPGQSDIMGILPGGRFLALEVKRPGGRPTQIQKMFLNKIHRNGGVAAVVSDVATVEKLLNEVGAWGRPVPRPQEEGVR